MENNFNTAPTEQELINAGFCKAGASNHSNYGKLIKRINDNLFVMFGGKKCSLHFDYGHVDSKIKHIEPTKAAINAEFKHFGQPIPQWEKTKPKIGEVWKNGKTVYLINDTVLKNTIRVTIISDNDLETGTIVNIIFYGLTKLADTLEDYYKEKFTKNNPLSELDKQIEELDDRLKQQTVIDTIEEMNKEIFKPTTIDPKSQVEKPHQKT